MNRTLFNTVLTEYFPGAVVSRQDLRSGWVDTIEIGRILVEITAYVKKNSGTPRPMGFYVSLRGRGDLQARDVILWHHSTIGIEEGALREALEALKMNLLGIAAAISQMCGFPEESNKEFDVDEFIRNPGADSIDEILNGLNEK